MRQRNCNLPKVKTPLSEWKSLSLTLCDPVVYTVHGILQARKVEWVAVPFSRGSSQSRDQTQVSLIACRFFTNWATREAHSVQFSSVTQSCPTLCDPMNCSMLGLPVHHQLEEFTQIHAHWVGDAIQPSHPVFPFSSGLQSLPTSGSFQMSQLLASSDQNIEFQLQHQSFQWIFRLISFRMDWLDLLAVQGALKSLLQHHSSKASILPPSNFFIVQLSSIHDYWKNHSLD